MMLIQLFLVPPGRTSQTSDKTTARDFEKLVSPRGGGRRGVGLPKIKHFRIVTLFMRFPKKAKTDLIAAFRVEMSNSLDLVRIQQLCYVFHLTRSALQIYKSQYNFLNYDNMNICVPIK